MELMTGVEWNGGLQLGDVVKNLVAIADVADAWPTEQPNNLDRPDLRRGYGEAR